MSAMPSNADGSSANPTRARLSRRDFLSLTTKTLLAISGLIGLGELTRFLSFQPDPPPPEQYDLGAADQYPPGSRSVISEARAILLHSPDGFSALSLVCPHLGCTLKQDQDGYACPCHGSKFDANGNLKNGPANKPMRALQVETTPNNRLILYTET